MPSPIPPPLFFHPTLDQYEVALGASGYFHYLLNTVLVTGFSTLIALLLGVPAAYSLAYYPTKRSNFTLMWVMSTRMLPAVGVIVPLYIIFKNLGWFDTYHGLIVLYTAMNLPLVIWMMRSFLLDLPYETLEAARIDGAGPVAGAAARHPAHGAPRAGLHHSPVPDLHLERVLPGVQPDHHEGSAADGVHRRVQDVGGIVLGQDVGCGNGLRPAGHHRRLGCAAPDRAGTDGRGDQIGEPRARMGPRLHRCYSFKSGFAGPEMLEHDDRVRS